MNLHDNNDPEAKKDFHWRQIFDSSIQGYCLIDRDYNIFDINTAFASIFGLNKDDILGKKCFEIYDGKLCHTSECLVNRIFRGEKNPFLAREVGVYNGTKIPCIVTARPYIDDQGNVTGVIQEVNDISTRKQPLPGFTDNLSKFGLYMSQSPDGIFVINTDGSFIDANPSGCEMLGYTTEELLGLHLSDIDLNPNKNQFEATQPSGDIVAEERVLKRKDGTDIIVNIKSVALGKNMYISYVRDITQRKLTEKTLSETEKRFKLYIDKSPYGIFVADERGKYLDVNSAACKLLGYTRKELLKKSIWDISPPDDQTENFTILKKTGELLTDKVCLIKKDGSYIAVELKAVSLENNRYMAFVTDITEKKLADQQVHQLHQELNSVLNAITDGFFALDKNLCFTYANKKTIETFQKDNLLGQRLSEIMGKENFRKCRNCFINALNKCISVSFEFHSDNGKWYEINIYPAQDRLSVYFRDVTEKKVFHEELSRLERLNLIGQMSAGIGHELRNPMTTVRGFLQMLGNSEPDYKKKEYYEVMIEELDRANSIITEFLSLAKNKSVNLQPTSLNKILNSLYPLISSDAIRQDKNIVLRKGEIPKIFLDEKEIRQLILNLVSNGLEAMSSGGIITLGTYKENDEVVLYVQDQGPGIDIGILDKLGNPFVTTKENGTGIGLAICYSIASRHNARIDIKTSVVGTTFLVRFKINKKAIREV